MDLGFTFFIVLMTQPDGLTVLHWADLTKPSTQCKNTYLLSLGYHDKNVNEHGSQVRKYFSFRSRAETA